jgi:hypothetical protein
MVPVVGDGGADRLFLARILGQQQQAVPALPGDRGGD